MMLQKVLKLTQKIIKYFQRFCLKKCNRKSSVKMDKSLHTIIPAITFICRVLPNAKEQTENTFTSGDILRIRGRFFNVTNLLFMVLCK